MNFAFKPEKAQQVILYVSSKITRPSNKYWVLKAIYFADKDHLHKYGRFVYGDQHMAMKHGPVPQKAYSMIENEKISEAVGRASTMPKKLFSVKDDNTVVPLVAADLSVFSKSDLECLDRAIEAVSNLSFGQLKKLSHDDAYESTGGDDVMSIESIAQMAPQHREELLDYLKDPFPH